MARTELGRLEEAEAAYRQSLKLAPGNKLALNQLKYIAQLKAGGARLSAALTSGQSKTGNWRCSSPPL